MTATNWHGRMYVVRNLGEYGILVTGPRNAKALVKDKGQAQRWLSCRSLRKGKARELVEAECKT